MLSTSQATRRYCAVTILVTGVATLSLLRIGGPAQAAAIATRTDLQTILGGSGTLEDFESYIIPDGSAMNLLDITVLDSTSVTNGQGPGLVIPGVSFSLGMGGFLQAGLGDWNGAAYFGSPSKEILTGNSILAINFASPVRAFGMDLRAFTGFGATATMSVFGPDGATPIGLISSIGLSDDGIPLFAGWEDKSGIGRVELKQFILTQHIQNWSPIIDNLEFGGRPVLEPSSLMLMLATAPFLYRLRRC
jgi:hypothetical protein